MGSAVTSVPGLIWGDAAKREDAGESSQINPFCWMALALWAVPTGFPGASGGLELLDAPSIQTLTSTAEPWQPGSFWSSAAPKNFLG